MIIKIHEQKKIQHVASDIDWDTDGQPLEDCGLPTSVVIPLDIEKDDVADWLSDSYGYLVNGFSINF